MREFSTGATRDNNEDKLMYHGFISPHVLERFAQYMHKHRKQADGKLRDPDNWKKGIPQKAYFESDIRHTIDFWKAVEEGRVEDAMELQMARMFNIQGWVYEQLQGRGEPAKPKKPEELLAPIVAIGEDLTRDVSRYINEITPIMKTFRPDWCWKIKELRFGSALYSRYDQLLTGEAGGFRARCRLYFHGIPVVCDPLLAPQSVRAVLTEV